MTVSGDSRPAVLVIDDSDVDREAMAAVLTRSGFQVHALPSPIGATRVAREHQVQVVVIDQNLAAMEGSKLATLFRTNPVMRHIRVVLVSGNDESAMADVAKRAQADAFVSKRELYASLASTVKRLLS